MPEQLAIDDKSLWLEAKRTIAINRFLRNRLTLTDAFPRLDDPIPLQDLEEDKNTIVED